MIDLEALRHQLHQYPELSHCETRTFAMLKAKFDMFGYDELLEFGSGGKGFLFRGRKEGTLTVFRAELDALPIREESDLDYVSKNPGVSHVCGHDGHMSILTGLGEQISLHRPHRGDVLLLFQSGEETGTGAEKVCLDPLFRKLNADLIFALHNIPGLPLHAVTTRSGVFSAASTGMIIEMNGKTSHAAEPEEGVNPDKAVAEVIRRVHEINKKKKDLQEVTFATVIHIDLGEKAFGTSPGFARVLVTLRSLEKNGLASIRESMEKEVRAICRDRHLSLEIDYKEEFPVTINAAEPLEYVQRAAVENGLPCTELPEPFRWSEDFGYFTETIPGCLFGLGAGESQPALHNPDYNFPDSLIYTGVKMFTSIYRSIHN